MSKELDALETFHLLTDDLQKWPDNSLAYAMQKEEKEQVEKALKEHEQCDNIKKEWKCDITKVNEMLKHGYWVKVGTKKKGFTYRHYVSNDENFICLRHLGYDVEICCVTSKNEWNAPITGFNEISLSEYGTRLALTKEELL